ncbi:hypothetical protein AXF42_Ash000626 [Apostasia shenzhenica]|uniref:Retrotransposon gag domain-containing protein n=1 Tax=Apostasia shenzhenica TaxID=1088818 RepID=A0A2I0AGV8_9ASPA|nr:hypothetical protein AXF42_Ash000626 [Apostasia shenzhenica]
MNAETKDTTDDRSTMIFVHSIFPGKLYDSFVDDMPRTLMEARSRAEKRIHIEDAKALKASVGKDPTTHDKKDGTPKAEQSTPKKAFRDRKFSPQGKRKFDSDSLRTPTLVYVIEEVFSSLQDRGFLPNRGERQPPQPGEDASKCCKFHQRYGHLLHECRSFRALVNEYIEKGHLTGYKKVEGMPSKAAKTLFPQGEPPAPATCSPSKSSGKKVVLSIFGFG